MCECGQRDPLLPLLLLSTVFLSIIIIETYAGWQQGSQPHTIRHSVARDQTAGKTSQDVRGPRSLRGPEGGVQKVRSRFHPGTNRSSKRLRRKYENAIWRSRSSWWTSANSSRRTKSNAKRQRPESSRKSPPKRKKRKRYKVPDEVTQSSISRSRNYRACRSSLRLSSLR